MNALNSRDARGAGAVPGELRTDSGTNGVIPPATGLSAAGMTENRKALPAAVIKLNRLIEMAQRRASTA